MDLTKSRHFTLSGEWGKHKGTPHYHNEKAKPISKWINGESAIRSYLETQRKSCVKSSRH